MLRMLSIFALLTTASPSVVETVADRDDASTELAGLAPARPGEAGLRVVRDPVSGRIVERPTPEQLARLPEGIERERRRPAPDEFERFELAGGGEGVFLDGWADQAMAVRRGADGSMSVTCSQGHEHRVGVASGSGDER